MCAELPPLARKREASFSRVTVRSTPTKPSKATNESHFLQNYFCLQNLETSQPKTGTRERREDTMRSGKGSRPQQSTATVA